MLAAGSLNELKKGIAVDGDSTASRPLSLEDYFIKVVGGERTVRPYRTGVEAVNCELTR